MSYFNDILKTNDPEKDDGSKYSLSRSLLLASTLITFILISVPFLFEIKLPVYENITDTIVFLITLFAGYSFGGKVMSSVGQVKKAVEEMRNKKGK